MNYRSYLYFALITVRSRLTAGLRSIGGKREAAGRNARAPGARLPGWLLVFWPGWVLVLLPIAAGALSTDSEQPLELAANQGQVDTLRRVSYYRGQVELRQGSMHITGKEMELYYTEDNKLRLVIMRGTPAVYRQLPDGSDQYDEASALQMEYYAQEGRVVLKEDAVIRRENLRFHGARLEYDVVNSTIAAQGTEKIEECAPEEKCDRRMHLIIDDPQTLRKTNE